MNFGGSVFVSVKLYNLLNLFATVLKWTPPKLPEISKQVDGNKYKVPLKTVSDTGLETFIRKNKIFSYAITSPEIFTYTTFNYKKT